MPSDKEDGKNWLENREPLSKAYDQVLGKKSGKIEKKSDQHEGRKIYQSA